MKGSQPNEPVAIHHDILAALTGSKRIEMLQLIHRFKSRQIQVQEFLASCRILLGPKLYGQLAENMNKINSASRLHNQEKGTPSSMVPEQLLAPGIQALSEALSKEGNPSGGKKTDKTTSQRQVVNSISDSNEISPKLSGKSDKQQSLSVNDQKAGERNTDTDVMQDIFQGSGIDLKEEAENIIKEQENLLSSLQLPSSEMVEDPRSNIDFLFNSEKLSQVVRIIAEKHGLVNSKTLTLPNSPVFDVLFAALKIRLANLIDDVVIASRHRVDTLRSRFKIKVENDPRRQLAILENCILNQQKSKSAPFIKPEQHVESGVSATTEIGGKESGDDISAAGSQPVKSNDSSVYLGEKDEQYIKTRLTNMTAMGQLGAPLKSWMTSSSMGRSSTLNSSSAAMNSTMLNISHSTSHHRFGEREWRYSVLERRITFKDLVFCMERDEYLSRSPLLSQAYMVLK
jgi:hypothetical protein